MAQLPHELDFVLDLRVRAASDRHDDFDLYRPDGDGPLPAVVIVPGLLPPGYPVPAREFPVYRGYGGLIASEGAIGVVADVPFHDVSAAQEAADRLARIVAEVRALDEVDGDRIAVWAFSAGAMLTEQWLADGPDWLRCLALSYPLWLAPPTVTPGRPLVVTRVGKELPERLDVLDRFLATATGATVIHVPEGQHGFDVLDHTEESRRAVLEAAELVAGHLLRSAEPTQG